MRHGLHLCAMLAFTVVACSAEPNAAGTMETLSGAGATAVLGSGGTGMAGSAVQNSVAGAGVAPSMAGASAISVGNAGTTSQVTAGGSGGSESGAGGSDVGVGGASSEGGGSSVVSTAGTAPVGVGGSTMGNAGAAGSAGGPPEIVTCPSVTLASGNTNRTVDVGGTKRAFIVHVPANYTGKEAVPLVVDFHALGGSGSQEQSSSGYQAVADREGFLIAFPDGIDNAWNIGPCCTNSRDVDDLGFAKAIVESIATDGCVDLKRVYAVGFSMGGGMSHYLACNAADVFAAVAPAAFDLLIPEEEPCAPSRPISVLAFRGTGDTVVPFGGGLGPSGKVTFLGAQASFQRWSEIDGCSEATTTNGDCTIHEQCNDGVQVGLCVAQGGSHAPGNATVGWEFLKQFTAP